MPAIEVEKQTGFIAWRIDKRCNFDCHSCFWSASARRQEEDVITTARLMAFLDSTHRSWKIGFSGGEPFLHSRFVELCAALVPRHRIQINTNLTLRKRIEAFAAVAPPEYVPVIIVGIHFSERERTHTLTSLIDNWHYLVDKGYKLESVYVLQPGDVGRYHDDARFLGEHGIKVVPKPIRGVFDGKEYPLAYTEAERAIFATVPGSTRRLVYDFEGVPCRAGMDCIRLENDGAVRRCGEKPVTDSRRQLATHSDTTMPTAETTLLGTLDGGVSFYSEAQPCRSPLCTCFGRHFTVLSPAQNSFTMGLRAFMRNDYATAAQRFTEALDEDPTYSSALNNLGVIRQLQGDRAGARQCYAAAREIHRHIPVYAKNLDGVDAGDREGGQLSITVLPGSKGQGACT